MDRTVKLISNHNVNLLTGRLKTSMFKKILKYIHISLPNLPGSQRAWECEKKKKKKNSINEYEPGRGKNGCKKGAWHREKPGVFCCFFFKSNRQWEVSYSQMISTHYTLLTFLSSGLTSYTVEPLLTATPDRWPLTLGPERISIHYNASQTPDLRPPVYSV